MIDQVKEKIKQNDKIIINLSMLLSEGEKGMFFKREIGQRKKPIGEQFTRLTSYDRTRISAEIKRIQAQNKALEVCFNINEPKTFNSAC